MISMTKTCRARHSDFNFREGIRVRVNILGPLEVTDEGVPVTIHGGKLRALLAVLSLAPNRPVTIADLIDELWGTDPPSNAENSLQGHISRLRRSIVRCTGKESMWETIETSPAGYRLVLLPQLVDASYFIELVSRADRVYLNDPWAAMALLTEALELWRGPALVDTGQGALCRMAYVRLTEIKLTAHERHFDVMLRLGLFDRVIAELEQLHARYPLRERLCEQLMTALYRSGRQADAVTVYHRTRQRLATGLGLEPGHALQARFQQVLRQKVSVP